MTPPTDPAPPDAFARLRAWRNSDRDATCQWVVTLVEGDDTGIYKKVEKRADDVEAAIHAALDQWGERYGR